MRYLWIALLLLLSNSISAGSDYYWVGSTSSWTTFDNWRIGSTSGIVPTVLPGSSDNVFISEGTAIPYLPGAELIIGGLTIEASKSLNLNGTDLIANGSVTLRHGSIFNSSAILSTMTIDNTDLTIGTATDNQGFTIGAEGQVDKILLKISTAKFKNYGNFNCYANLELVYKANTSTPADNFIQELGSNNYYGTFMLTLNENTVATKFGESAGIDTFWKTAVFNKYSNVDFSIGTTSDLYSAVFKAKLTLNGESKVGNNMSNLILGNQCNAVIAVNAGMELLFSRNTNIILGKHNATKQPTINILGSISAPIPPASYTSGNFEAYKTIVTAGNTSINLGNIGAIIIDKTSSFTGITTINCNSLSINESTFDAAIINMSSPDIKIANTSSVVFNGNLSLMSPQFTSATILGGTAAIKLSKDLTIHHTVPITSYSNSNVHGFKYVEFNGYSGLQRYMSNSIVPFYKVDINKFSGDLQLHCPLFMNYTEDNAIDVITLNLKRGKIIGSNVNRVVIYRDRYDINSYTNYSYIAAGLAVTTNLSVKKFFPVGSLTGYSPIEITCNTGNGKFIEVSYYAQNPQVLNTSFGGALDVSHCEYWKIVELDDNLSKLSASQLFDLGQIALPYMASKCTKVSQTNHALGYSHYSGIAYTPWEKLTTMYAVNSDAATMSYIAGTLSSSTPLLKQQAEILVSFSYQNVIYINTKDVFSNPCVISTATDGAYAFTSGHTGTNSGVVKIHPELGEALHLKINNIATESIPYEIIINVDTYGSISEVKNLSGHTISNYYIPNNYTLTFINNELGSDRTYQQYTNNLEVDGIRLLQSSFWVKTPVGLTPQELKVYNQANSLVGFVTAIPTQGPNTALAPISIPSSGSYRFTLKVKDFTNVEHEVTGFFLK